MQTRPEPDMIENIIETRLRETAPALPPELRQRVLRQCREQQGRKPRFLWQRQWNPACALTGFALFCWIGSSRLDAQNRAMIAGSGEHQTTFTQAIQADSPNYRSVLRWRLHQLALLLQDRRSG